MSGPPPSTPSQPPPAPGSRPGGLSAAEHQAAMQRQRQQQQQQQRLRALEHEQKLAAVDDRAVAPHHLDDGAWAGFLDRSSTAWREEHGRVVEWWVRRSLVAVPRQEDGGEEANLDGAGDGGDRAELLGALGSVRRAHGCCAVTLGDSCSLADVGNVVAIEWANANARRSFHTSSEASTRFTRAIQQANLRRFLTYAHLEQSTGSIIDYAAHAATQVHEVWTACFPTDLPPDVVEIIERHEGPFQLPRDRGGSKRQPEAQEALYGASRRSHGWALVEDGGAEYYENRPVRRMVYVFLWESEEARRLYRNEAIWRTTTCHGRVFDRPTDAFLCELEELGMLGLERWDYLVKESSSIS